MSVMSPLSIILVQNGSKGDKLLFLYPYDEDIPQITSPVESQKTIKSHYAAPAKHDHEPPNPNLSNIDNGRLVGYSDKVLSNLFAVKSKLCGRKFELKVNDVRFVGHPTSLQTSNCVSPKLHVSSILLFNIVFALRSNASHSVVNCYHDLSQRLGAALRHEERRCGYLSKEAKIMLGFHDETAEKNQPLFGSILPQSQLAQEMKAVYDSLCNTGIVSIFMNNWVEVSFCLPQRVHSFLHKSVVIEPETLQKCFAALKPYHAVLLLVDEKELRASLDSDASPTLARLVRVTSPLKSIQQLSADADLPLQHVMDLVSHLVYWAKATIIFPLCESNVYVLSPNATTHISSSVVEKFTERFPKSSLLAVMSEFSFPISLVRNPMILLHQQIQLVQMVVWMLQHRILMQLHTYIYLISTPEGNVCSSSNHSKRVRSFHFQHQALLEDYSSSKVKNDVEANLINNEDQPNFSNGNSDLLKDEHLAKSLHETLPANLSPVEKENILKIPSSQNAEDLILFSRLCKYFRGQHHLEEIMYIENVRRSHILALLDKFRKVLFTCQHEDKAVAMFYKNNKNI